MINEIEKYFKIKNFGGNELHDKHLINAFLNSSSANGLYTQPVKPQKSNKNCFVCQKATSEIFVYCDYDKPISKTIVLASKEKFYMNKLELMSMSGDILIDFDDDSEEASKITLSSIEREKRPLELMCSDYNQDITVNFLTHHKPDEDFYTIAPKQY